MDRKYMVWIENWTKDPEFAKIAAKIRLKARRRKADELIYEDADRLLIESSDPRITQLVRTYATVAPWALLMVPEGLEDTWDVIKALVAAKQVSERALGWHGMSERNLVRKDWVAILRPNARASTRYRWVCPIMLARVDLTTWLPLAKQGEACKEAYRRLLHMAEFADNYVDAGQSREGWRARLREVREDAAKWLACPWATSQAGDIIDITICAVARAALRQLNVKRNAALIRK